MARWQGIARLGAEQHGVVSRAQLRNLGIGDTSISRLVKERGWTRVHPGVYRLPGSTPSFSQRVKAAQLALPVDSVATALTAAHLHGLVDRPSRIHLLVGEHDRLVPPSGTYLIRTRTLEAGDVTEINGIRVATGCRTLIDCARASLPDELRALLIDARQRRLVELQQVTDRLARLGTVRGRGVLRQLVWELDESRCDSVLEARVRGVLAHGQITPPDPHPVAVRTGGRTLHLDIGWPDLRVGIEVDGFAYHASRQALERDQRRANALTLAGWTVLRIGWGRVERDREGFLAEVRALLSKAWSDHDRMRK